MHRCSYAHDFDILPPEVRGALEGEAYAAFVGTPPGEQVPARDHTGPHADVQVPSPLAETTRRLIATASFRAYTANNHRLSERLSHEAASWCNTEWSRLNEADPLRDEETRLRSLEHTQSLEEARSFMPPEARHRLHDRAMEIFSESLPEPAENRGATVRVEQRARIAAIAQQWRRAIEGERESFQTRELGRSLGAFVREIGAVLPRLARAQSVVRDLFGTDDPLWDQSRGAWEDTRWEALEYSAGKLAQLPELDRLAEILGRSHVATEVTTTIQTIRRIGLKVVGLGKSEVQGLNFGDDLTSLLPSEVALLSDPSTEDLFYAKLAHKELLQLDYRRERIVEHTHLRRVPVTKETVVPRGPVIMCVDTSGSMLGDPEEIAKAMTLALARRLSADHRHLYVVAFSTGIRSLTVDPAAPDLSALCDFLAGSFHGGTDIRPALVETLRILDTNRFKYADVLVVSDFKVPKIADRFIDQIKSQQRLGTLFHSLTVARGPVRDPFHIFDNSWLFNVTEGMRGIRPDTLRFLG